MRAASVTLTLVWCTRMWCPHCQRDVPQAAASASAPHKCSLCGCSVAYAREVHCAHKPAWRTLSDDGLDLETAQVGPQPPRSRAIWDEWTLAAEVQRARHLLSVGSGHSPAAEWRIDDVHSLIEEAVATRRRPVKSSMSYRGGNLRGSWRKASLAALALGVGAFCYGVATAASLVDVSGTVSRFGVPLMLIGLFGLVLGLLIQVLSISRASSAAVDRMRLVELRLQEYRQAALLVSPTSQVGALHHSARFGRALGADLR
jgi:hypothetical protein